MPLGLPGWPVGTKLRGTHVGNACLVSLGTETLDAVPPHHPHLKPAPPPGSVQLLIVKAPLALGLACTLHTCCSQKVTPSYASGCSVILVSPSSSPPPQLSHFWAGTSALLLCAGQRPPAGGAGPFHNPASFGSPPRLDAIARGSCLADSPLSQCLKGQHLKASAGAREGE